mgnify:CR=1 FL=1
MIKLSPLISAAILLTLYGCSRQMNFDERCRKEAQMQTKKVCPKVITPGITLDSITYDTKTESCNTTTQWKADMMIRRP